MDPRKLSAALLVATVLVAACSSGGSTRDGDGGAAQESQPETSPTEDAGPTTGEFIAEAESVCVSTSKKTQEILADSGVPTNDKENRALGQELIDVRRDRLRQLEALEVPEELQAQWDEYLEVREDSFDLIVERQGAIEKDDTDRAGSLADKIEKLDAEWQSIGEDIGFMACANKLSPEDAKQIEAVITQFFEGDPTKTCSGFVSKAYLDYLGGKDGCVQSVEKASKISITDLEGIDQVTADAVVTGSTYGKRVSAELTYEGGEYKMRILFIL